jgi:hypothetical protein
VHLNGDEGRMNGRTRSASLEETVLPVFRMSIIFFDNGHRNFIISSAEKTGIRTSGSEREGKTRTRIN